MAVSGRKSVWVKTKYVFLKNLLKMFLKQIEKLFKKISKEFSKKTYFFFAQADFRPKTAKSRGVLKSSL